MLDRNLSHALYYSDLRDMIFEGFVDGNSVFDAAKEKATLVKFGCRSKLRTTLNTLLKLRSVMCLSVSHLVHADMHGHSLQ